MRLELQVSNTMTREGENDIVRLPPHQKMRLGVKEGRTILLSASDGSKLRVRVKDVYLEDLVKDKTLAYVSRGIFNAISGVIISPGPMSLGCDPEFILVDHHKRVLPANLWFPHEGVIGSDGPLAELRPAPALHESDVVDNLKGLIHSLPGILSSKFGSARLIQPEGHSCWENYALGFHIHLGAPREIITFAAPETQEFIRSFITAMDYFVGIPAMLLEDSSTRRLGSGSYGKPGDYRITSKTIEYRTPGGFHLRHPEYAAGILGLALCVGKELMEKTAQLSSNWRNLNKFSDFQHVRGRFDLPAKSDIRWAIQEPTKRVAISHIPNLIKQVKTLKYYDQHANSIRKYFRLVGEHKQFTPNLLNNW